MSEPRPRRRLLARLLDPRVILGLAITALALWISFRDLDFAALLHDMRRANLALLILPSVPAYLWATWVRALRWRHLAEAVAPMERGPVFRATAVGFMVNNVFPLRLGEVVRAWVLAREVRASGTALFGTVIVERIIDSMAVLALAAGLLGTEGARAWGINPAAVLAPLAVLVAAPVSFIAALRAAPEFTIGLAVRTARVVFPNRALVRLERGLRQLGAGMAGLRTGRGLFWVLVHTVVIWAVCSVIPFGAALLALDLGLGPGELVRASFAILVFVGAAVALPSAPGFFGPYHAACWFALRPFGVEKESAVALGTLAHAVFWVSMTGLGLLVLRRRGTGLEETLSQAAEQADAGPTP
jgi:uncharacterized protein (TIRG00374 family)